MNEVTCTFLTPSHISIENLEKQMFVGAVWIQGSQESAATAFIANLVAGTEIETFKGH